MCTASVYGQLIKLFYRLFRTKLDLRSLLLELILDQLVIGNDVQVLVAVALCEGDNLRTWHHQVTAFSELFRQMVFVAVPVH